MKTPKKNNQKILWGVLIILITLLGGVFLYLEPLVNKYLNDKAEEIINRNQDNPYTYALGHIEIDLWHGGFHIDSFKMTPKDSTKKVFESGKLKSIIEVNSGEIFLTGFDVFKFYGDESIVLNEIRLESPKVFFRNNFEIRDTIENIPIREMVRAMENSLTVNEINFKNVAIKFNADIKKPQNVMFVDSLDFIIQDLYISPKTADLELPFEVSDVIVKSEHVSYQLESGILIGVQKLHFSLIEKKIESGKLLLKANSKFSFEMDALKVEGIDLVSLIDSNKIRLEEVDLTHPSATIYEQVKREKREPFSFSELTKIPLDIGDLNISDALFRVYDKDNIEKVNVSAIDLDLFGLSNTKTNDQINFDSLRTRCNPLLKFKDSKSGEKKRLSINDFQLEINNYVFDSLLLASDRYGTSGYFELNLKKLEYDVIDKTHFEFSGFEINKQKQTLHLSEVLTSSKGKKKYDGIINSKIAQIKLSGIDLKSIASTGKINVSEIDVIKPSIDLEHWESNKKEHKTPIDFDAYIGIPINVKKINISQSDFYIKEHLLDKRIEEMKISDVAAQIIELDNQRISKKGQEIGAKKVVIDCKPRIMLIDSLGEIDRIIMLDDLNIELFNVVTRKDLINKKVPIRVKDYNIDLGGLVYNLDAFYTLKVRDIQLNKLEKSMAFDRVSIKSKYQKMKHTRKFGFQTEYVDLEVDEIKVQGFDLKQILLDEKLFINQIILTNTNLNLLRNKNIERSEFVIKKPLPVEQIRAITFPFSIKNIELRNSTIHYEEVPEGKKEPGSIFFDKLYCSINNVTNVNQFIKSNAKMTLDIDADFMGTIGFEAKYTFNLSDKTAPFKLIGRVDGFDMTIMHNTMDRLLGIGVKSGKVSWIKFEFEANDEESNGWFDMYYEDFTVKSGFKKDIRILGVRSNWLFTGAANAVIVPHNTNVRKFRRGIIKTDRLKDRSVFNYTWHSLKSGIMSSIGLRKHTKIELY